MSHRQSQSATELDLDDRGVEAACDLALFGAVATELHDAALDPSLLSELELLAGEIAVAAFESAGDGSQLPAHLLVALAPLAEREVLRFTGGSATPVAVDAAPATPRPAPASAAVVPITSAPRRLARVVPWLVAAAAIVVAFVATRRPTDPPVAAITAGPVPSVVITAAPSVVAAAPVVARSAAEQRDEVLALPGTQRIAWTATKDPAATGASGDVVWHNGVQRGAMRFAGLAPNDPKKSQYQLWIFDAERDQAFPVDGGVFDVGPSGEVIVPIAAKLPVHQPKLFAITVEPPGGVVVSKRERIVLTAALGS